MRDGWSVIAVGTAARIASGQVDPKDAAIGSMISVGPDNLPSGGGIDLSSLKTAQELEQISGKYAFDENSILYSKIRPNLNKVALPDFAGICSADMYPMWVSDEERTDRRFLYYTLLSEKFVAAASSRSFRTGLPKINREDLESIEILLPPLVEQRKIAKVLQTWDDAIAACSALRRAKDQRLQALRAKLLFGALRIGAPRSNWPLRRLGEVTSELSKRNNKLALDRSAVMGVSNTRGIVPMREQTVADDISRYKLLPPAGFAYNPMRINVGSIAMNKARETFLVSPDYVSFTCNPDGLVPDYLDHLRQTRWWLHHINAGGSGSVRQRTYYDDLAALQLRLPDTEEQRTIVAVLNAAAADVDLTDREIAALGRQKRGLMQKLLTGEWHVHVDGEAK